MFILKAFFFILTLPFRLLFWWIPNGDDSYDNDEEEYAFWRDHGHNY